ncbi:Crp/Fnr family transcriptional regulator [Phenylobacterium sp.]|uniref:Crp/Fnr family transcriptional regulator n=1 Tax=Phenylobacterium sp. TaxID=1871053 RepID=UPI002B668B6B|nr:helix-turn-helix domain-containing protein [Phenylobacterium sp.]HVI31073.1 helix-turn-helix domain-containing protein [Phenylobacterium sp.]
MSALAQAVRPSTASVTFNAFGGLQALQVEQVRAFWRSVERFEPGVQLECAPGQGVKRGVILSGWACEMRILPDGRRQIFSFLLPGDPFLIEEHADLGGRGVVALTRLEVMDWANPFLAGAEARETLARAMNEAGVQKQDRLMDQMVRIGRLTARERVLHLLLELCDRLEAVGLVRGDTFRIPLTQVIFADALGLSLVHINRTLKQLRREGHIVLKSGSVTLLRREKLAGLAFYHPPGMAGVA